MHYTHNTLSENSRGQSVELLNRHLAAAIDLHAQVKQAHWNVRGSSFSAVHELSAHWGPALFHLRPSVRSQRLLRIRRCRRCRDTGGHAA